MPPRRALRAAPTLFALLVLPALLVLAHAPANAPAGLRARVVHLTRTTPSSPDTALNRLVTRGGAPAAALLTTGTRNSRYAHAESSTPRSPADGRTSAPGSRTPPETASTPVPSNRTDSGTAPAPSTGTGTGTGTGTAAKPSTSLTTTPTPGTTGSTPTAPLGTAPLGTAPLGTAPLGTAAPGAITPLHRGDHFRAGSVTKTFIATVVLQLAAEGRLSLSDTVEDRLPGLVRGAGNDGRTVTLRALLTHTSGLADFTADTGAVTPLTARQAVRIALTHPPAAVGRFSYSNTNYVLLGMVIQHVTGRSYAAEAERRLISPLRLTGTSFPGARTSLPLPHGRAYAADGSDVTELDPRVAGAAGELITTLDDLNRFQTALLRGDLLPPRYLREMLDTRAAQGVYGMGLYPVKLPCGITVWGHNGRMPGSYVRTAATVDGRRVLTFRVNTDAVTDPGLEPALVAAEFCPRTS